MIADKIQTNLQQSSLIRAMFEEGETLRKKVGAENVFDFSLGNPDPEPPQAFKDALKTLVLEDAPGLHAYMNNAGYPQVREKIAAQIHAESGRNLTAQHIVMTVGAGGALNVILKTILNPDDEVIVFKPYFTEYKFYVDNHGGQIVELATNPKDFAPDLQLLEQSINAKTRAVLINSPNNPTGVVYSEQLLQDMAAVIERKEREFSREIFLIADEPYKELVYDGIRLPQVFNIFKNAMIATSFSKSQSIPGARIGYLAVNDRIADVPTLINGLIFANRTLGYVNAPGLFQKAAALALGHYVDKNIYAERRNILYHHLIQLGFTCVKPQGAFYLFPKALIDDDMAFKDQALTHNLIIVPGRTFGCPGYFRLSYCVSMQTIERSLAAFTALAHDFGQRV
ncbi:MAG: pyridoxal phosphate-dependent aminotransferase [Peptococcaceae bacterium]|jgi:aspartate aminotransferase|nr:pyridoxal phosphate-dependent aminotransferase [Peptococcaceae bacterium]